MMLLMMMLPLSPTLPHRKSGLPDLRKINRNPGKPGLLGGGSSDSMPRGVRSLLLATALLAAFPAAALAQVRDDVIAAPVLRANVTVSGDLVRIGDLIDNAGTSAQIAIYRAPDLGTTGSLPTAQVLNVLRARQVIGVATGDIKEVKVTRLARTVEVKEIELQVARAIEHRGGLG